jgi:hypothetical protein
METPAPGVPLASVSEPSILWRLRSHNGQLGNLGLDIWLVFPLVR